MIRDESEKATSTITKAENQIAETGTELNKKIDIIWSEESNSSYENISNRAYNLMIKSLTRSLNIFRKQTKDDKCLLLTIYSTLLSNSHH